MKKIITTTGYMCSGSSAVTDLLQEYNIISNKNGSFEYVFLHGPNGVFDLEDGLLMNNTVVHSDYSIKAFKKEMYDLFNIRFWWCANYKNKLGPRFKEFVDDYIDNITDLKFKSHWYYSEKPTKIEEFSILIKKVINKLSLNQLHIPEMKLNSDIYMSFIDENDFYKYTNEFIYNVCNYINPSEVMLLDQLVLPHNLYRLENYFDDNFRCIVIERDPRDVFLENKYRYAKDYLDVPFPTDVDQFIKYYKKMRDNEKPVDDDRILRIYFEDLIVNYDETVKKIENFIGLSEQNHTYPKKYLKPEKSIKNVGLYKKYKGKEAEIKKIEDGLSKYCYNLK